MRRPLFPVTEGDTTVPGTSDHPTLNTDTIEPHWSLDTTNPFRVLYNLTSDEMDNHTSSAWQFGVLMDETFKMMTPPNSPPSYYTGPIPSMRRQMGRRPRRTFTVSSSP